MKQSLKLFVGDESLVAMRGIIVENNEPEVIIVCCPHCRNPKRKYKIVARVTQFGFEWDVYTDFRKCRCGTLYFAEYKLWHDLSHLNNELESVVSE